MTSAWADSGKSNINVQFGDSSNLDAFGRLRVSQPLSLNISKFEYSPDVHYWPSFAVGVGSSVTHLPDESSNLLTCGPDIGDRIVKQAKIYVQYQPGNSQLGMMTGVFSTPVAGYAKRVGLYDDENGVFLEQGADGLYYIVLRSSVTGSPVETRVVQSDWKIDRFNYAGEPLTKPHNPSRKNIDFTKAFILFVDLEWLGVGRARGGFVQDGVIYYAHEFLHAGVSSAVYMTTASLPIRYEIINISGSATATMRQICSTIKSEGGQEVFGIPQVARRSFYAPISVPDTSATTQAYTPILSIRPRQTFHGKDFRGVVVPVSTSIFVEGNFPVEFLLVHDATLTKGAGLPLDPADWNPIYDEAGDVPSCTEFTLAATAVDITSGHVHLADFATGDNKGSLSPAIEQTKTSLQLSNGIYVADRAETDTYTLVARSKGGTTTVSAMIRVTEIR